MDWRHRAICRDEDPELFFPIGNTGPALLQIEQAKMVCRRCPIAMEEHESRGAESRSGNVPMCALSLPGNLVYKRSLTPLR